MKKTNYAILAVISMGIVSCTSDVTPPADVKVAAPVDLQKLERASHVSQSLVDSVHERFTEAFDRFGMSGVVEDIQHCYAQVDDNPAESEGYARRCVLYDMAAAQMDSSFREEFAKRNPKKSHAHDVPSIPYLEAANYQTRLDKYLAIGFDGWTRAEIAHYYGDTANTVAMPIAQPSNQVMK